MGQEVRFEASHATMMDRLELQHAERRQFEAEVQQTRNEASHATTKEFECCLELQQAERLTQLEAEVRQQLRSEPSHGTRKDPDLTKSMEKRSFFVVPGNVH